jgi:cycloeucalenol cycloisomerase
LSQVSTQTSIVTLSLRCNEERKMKFFSTCESKAWGDKFFLLYAPLWISYFGFLILTNYYANASRLEWVMYGVIMVIPLFAYPLLFPGKADRHLPITQRYWFKANVWVAIFNYVGNYFWTHYFYNLLGAKYTMDTYRINNVPYLMFLATQAYFTFYHSLINVVLRMFYSSWPKPSTTRFIAVSLLVFSLAVFTAFMETFTIQAFPFYTHKDKLYMYTIGSVFYSLYFIVSFPMFFRMDEDPTDKWPLSRVIIDSLGSAMLVTILLDLWRLAVGGIPGSPECVPFL